MGLFAIMKGKGGVYVNLYNDCRFKTELDGSRVSLAVKADPYRSDGARIKLDGGGKSFTLALRIPTWAEDFTVLVNGQKIEAKEKNGYLLIYRVWQKDRIDLSFRAAVKMSVINNKIAFVKGPIALAGDSRFGDISKPLSLTVRDGKAVRARRVKNGLFSTNIAYEVNTKEGKIILCDYAQAGKDFDYENSGLTVWYDKKQKI